MLSCTKKSEKSAFNTFGVPRQTLRRHLQKVRDGNGVAKVLGRPKVLTATQENELVDVILDMERKLFGLTKMDVRRLAFT